MTNARGGVTRLEYDLAGRLTRVDNDLGEATTLSYDRRGQLPEFDSP